MRRYLGEDADAPIRHPALSSGFDLRVMGVKVPEKADTSATVIASVGCPMGCNFCTTSAFFGGKGKVLNFYETGDELFDVMEEAESSRKVKSFFIMDENFLLQRRRAMDLLARMKRARKSWAFNIFSSANAIRKGTASRKTTNASTTPSSLPSHVSTGSGIGFRPIAMHSFPFILLELLLQQTAARESHIAAGAH